MMTKAIEPRAAFQKYVGVITERPAFERAAQDEQILKQLQQPA